MTSSRDIRGKTVTARVIRAEEYGLYLDHEGETILVLIPDVSDRPIGDLRREFQPGEPVAVRVLRYVEARAVYKGTIKDL